MQGLGVKDDKIANVTKEEMLGELRHDVEAYEKAIDNAQKDVDNYKEQLELDIKHWDLLVKPGAIRKINPERVFEQDEAYWEIAEKKQNYAIREQRAMAEGKLKQLESVVEGAKEAKKLAEAKLARFEAD